MTLSTIAELSAFNLINAKIAVRQDGILDDL
jgi:hypothetical protein